MVDARQFDKSQFENMIHDRQFICTFRPEDLELIDSDGHAEQAKNDGDSGNDGNDGDDRKPPAKRNDADSMQVRLLITH